MRTASILLFIFSSLIQTTVYAATNGCEQQHCVAIVDVGSTGSRLHLYSYDVDKSNSPIQITERWSKKIKPGFATIEANPATIDAYLTTLFSGAPNYRFPVYFYATAGMRLLSHPKQQQFYNYVKNWFENQSEWQLVDAKTITGKEEGLYGWLAINYQLGSLNNENAQAMGFLDMGGASVQIAFPIKNTREINNDDIQQLDIYGHHFKLFIHSFLGLGQTEVTHQFLDSKSCFATNYEMPSGQSAEGDAPTCSGEVSSLMNAVHQVNSVVQPAITANPVSNWFTSGGITEMVKSKPFNFAGTFTNQDLLDQANSEVCHQQWSTINSKYLSNDFLFGYCLFPSYYYALMVNGYGIPPQQTLNYLSETQNSDWTIGVILHQQV